MTERDLTPLKTFSEKFANSNGIALGFCDTESVGNNESHFSQLVKQYVGDTKGCSKLIGLGALGNKFDLFYLGWAREEQLNEVLRIEKDERIIDVQSYPGYNGQVVIKDLKVENALRDLRKFDGMGSNYDSQARYSFGFTRENHRGLKFFLDTMLR